MRILLQASAGACLVAAMMLGLAANSSGRSAGAAAPGCQVPDYLATHSPGNRTPAGYYEYQAWIANDQAQTALDGLQSLVQSHFGLSADSGDADALAKGLIGLALDDAAQTVDLVVDPSRVDPGALGALASAAVARRRRRWRPIVPSSTASARRSRPTAGATTSTRTTRRTTSSFRRRTRVRRRSSRASSVTASRSSSRRCR